MAVLFGKPIVLTLRTFPSPICLFWGLLSSEDRTQTSTPNLLSPKNRRHAAGSLPSITATLPSKYEPLILVPVPAPIVFKLTSTDPQHFDSNALLVESISQNVFLCLLTVHFWVLQ